LRALELRKDLFLKSLSDIFDIHLRERPNTLATAEGKDEMFDLPELGKSRLEAPPISGIDRYRADALELGLGFRKPRFVPAEDRYCEAITEQPPSRRQSNSR